MKYLVVVELFKETMDTMDTILFNQDGINIVLTKQTIDWLTQNTDVCVYACGLSCARRRPISNASRYIASLSE